MFVTPSFILGRYHREHQPGKAMSLSEDLHLWQQTAQDLEAQVRHLVARVRHLEARVRHLEAENRAPAEQTGTGQVVAPDEHGRENVAINRPPGRNQARPAPEPTERNTYVADKGQGQESGFNVLTFVAEAPQGQQLPAILEVDNFLAAGPKKDKNWQERRQNLGLSEPRSVIQIFFQLITRTAFSITPSSITPSSETGEKSSEVEALLQHYEHFVQNLRQDTARMQQIRDFAILLLVCLCRVASVAKKIPTARINSHMNEILPKKRTDKRRSSYLTRLRTSVLWPIRQAEGLRPWLGNRADEFFLLCKPLMETLYR